MLTSEAVPFAKTGGLADAVPALAAALSNLGHDVRLIMPRYYGIDRSGLEKFSDPLGVPMGDQERWCAVYRTLLPDTRVPVYLLDREDYFGRDGIYGPDGSHSWPDNALRYSFLSAAAFQLCRQLHWIPQILHAHDWPSAPSLFMLDAFERQRGFSSTVSVLTIHNLGYQGIFSAGSLKYFAHFGEPEKLNGILRPEGVNFLALGIEYADEITTVSPSYAREILQEEFSEGLGELINRRKDNLTGILNGMDYNEWNPAMDPALTPHQYEIQAMAGKSRVKNLLQKEMGLKVDPDVPLFGIITRLTGQKGVDLLTDPDGPVVRILREERAQLVVLGTGEKKYEDAFLRLADTIGSSYAVRIAFSGPLSRRIEAGCDFFLMPSRYEPCGLNQLYSLRYGTLPVVRRTGGLADTVVDIRKHPDSGTGFVFEKASSDELAQTMEDAIRFYREQPARFSEARKRGMMLRFDWANSAKKYLELYRKARIRRTGRFQSLRERIFRSSLARR